jgi:hypothetical protein
MLTCEKCKATFPPAQQVTEVTSLRVLCPACLAEHQAAKARRARELAALEQKPAPAAPPARPAPPATRPQASTPAAEHRRAPAPAEPAKPRAAAAPVRPRERSTERQAERPGAARAGAGEQRSRAQPAALPREEGKAPDKRARKGAAEPAPKAKRSRGEREHHASDELKKQGTREIVVAFAGAGLVLVVAGVVLWKVLDKKRAEAAETQARLDKIEAFRSEFMGFDITSEEGAKLLLAFAEGQKAQWEDAEFAADVVTRTAKAKTFLQSLEERRTLTQRLDEIEAALARADELSPGELAEQRRRLEELAPRGEIVGADFVARLAQDRESSELLYLERLQASAQAAAASQPLDRAALATIQQAEDEILKIYETSYRAWQRNNQDPAVIAKKDDHQERYQAIIQLSDGAVERFFTPQVIESTPWRDLLSSEQAAQWRGATVAGFEHRIGDGVMHLIGPDPAEKSEGILSIGDKEAWRDFVLDMEFTIDRGQCTLFFRLPPVWQENVEAFDLTTEEGHLEAGRSYVYSFSVVGSTFVQQEHSEDSLGPTVEGISWTKVRKGAFAISIPKESEVRFTRLRAKVLR